MMIEYENLRRTNEVFLDDLKASFANFLDSGWYILGDRVSTFEAEFAAYVGTRHCIGVASGLDALILSLDAFDLQRGSEVIVPSNTYIATILAIVRLGLIPILVEPDLRTYNIDPERVREKISPATKAIVPVHLYGKSCEMNELIKIAEENDLQIVEDCAQAHGAKFEGKKVGSFGTGCFSFYPTKNLGAFGDAGAITTDDDVLAERLRTLRNYGSKLKYHNEIIGYNSRLDEIQAVFLSLKLKRLDEINDHKRRLAEVYLKRLDDRFIKPVCKDSTYDVYHIFNIRVKNREALRAYLAEKGVKTDVHYPVPPHQQPAMANILSGSYPISEEIHRTTVSLPVAFFHTENDIHTVCDIMNSWSGE